MMYITEMLRWGNDESHHYILGVYSTREAAAFAGETEKSWRGVKYDLIIFDEAALDAVSGQEQYEHHMQCT